MSYKLYWAVVIKESSDRWWLRGSIWLRIRGRRRSKLKVARSVKQNKLIIGIRGSKLRGLGRKRRRIIIKEIRGHLINR